MRNRGPYPVPISKVYVSAILLALLDPNTAPLRALPREDRDLRILAGLTQRQLAQGLAFTNGPRAIGN